MDQQQQFLLYVQQIFQYVRRSIIQEYSLNILNSYILQINNLCSILLRLLQRISNNNIAYTIINGLLIEANELKEELISKLNNFNSELSSHNNLVLQLPSTGGRPKYDISIESVCFMRREGFSWTSIAGILGVSIKTIKRRLIDNNIFDEFRYSNITDQELDERLQWIRNQ